MVHILLIVIYLAFIGLGLPDGLLGSAWPVMYPVFEVPVSSAGVVSFIISMGTVVSSLLSDRLTRKLGCGKVTAISVAMTAVAIFGFSVSREYWQLCLWAIPYGLGAGSVDASLNNYVALHYASRHMSWLHCMWGLGASIGPYIMGFALSSGQGWNMGYRYIGLLQIVLSVILFFRKFRQGQKSTLTHSLQLKSIKLSIKIFIPSTLRMAAAQALICPQCSSRSACVLSVSERMVREKES